MKLITLEKVDSTNSYGKLNIDTLEDGTVIRAKVQTSGRGRLNRSWIDLGENNIFCSIILKPSENFSKVYTNITQYLAVTLSRVLEKYGVKPQIKWPNDVLIDGKKIAGILSESVLEGHKFKGIVLGFGINLNATKEAVESISDKIVTALNLELNKKVDADKFLQELSDEFFTNYDEFLNNGFNYIKDYYLEKNCFLGKQLKVQVFNDVKKGLAKSISDNGELILQTEDNNDITLTIGDIL